VKALDVIYKVATVVIAGLAIWGSLKAREDSRKVADALAVVTAGVRNVTEPVVAIGRAEWIEGGRPGPALALHPVRGGQDN